MWKLGDILKALAVEHTVVTTGGKWETRIPTCLELIERRVKPLTEEEYSQLQTKKKQRYEQNKKNALKVYEKLKEKLERQLKGKEKAVARISQIVENIEKELREDPTNTTLMKKFQYWFNVLTIRQKQVEALKQELEKFEQFLEKFETIPAEDFPLWEDVGQSKGTPPRRYAEIEEYSDTQGFTIHYLETLL